MRDNADLMDEILDAQQREYERETLVWEMVEEMWEDVYTKITRTMDHEGWNFDVEVIDPKFNLNGKNVEMCIGSFSSDDRDEATDMAERVADTYFEKVARAKLGVR